jgi:rRNA maturation endonuclease Nob1
MGVLRRTDEKSEASEADGEFPQYVCMACDTAFEVQHHICPVCGSFDVRCSKWVQK